MADKYFLKVRLLFFVCFAFCSNSWASTVVLSENQHSINITPYLTYIEDPSSILSIKDIAQKPNSAWKIPESREQNLNFGYTDSSYWLRFTTTNNANKNMIRFLEFAYPVLDQIDIYMLNNNELAKSLSMGDKLPFAERPIKHHHFIVPLNFSEGSETQFYIRVKTSSSMQIPITLWDEATLLEATSKNVLNFGLYYGTMLVMVLYNLFVFFSVREATYLYYVLFVACMATFLASLNGISYQYLWPTETSWNDQSILVFLTAAMVFGALFTRDFLKLKIHKPVINKLFMYAITLVGITLLSSFFLPYSIVIRIVILEGIIATILGISVGIIRWSEGDTSAKFYTIAWSVLLMGGFILAFNKFNFLPRNAFTENATQLGSALEVILLSLALADRLNTEKRARYSAQQKSLENERLLRLAQAETLSQEQEARIANEKALQLEKEARTAQAKALEIQTRANETLELRVKERTTELEKANRKLEQLTFTDGLTNIRNRRYFDKNVEAEFHRAYREQDPLSLLVIDIDHFKQFNDKYGHLTGDDCLRAVAHTIRGQIHRDTDVVARYGGEEFVVLMPNTDEAGAKHIAEKIRQQVEQLEFLVDGNRVPITISIGGITHTPKDTQGKELFVASADEALYASKEGGRNRVTMYAVDHPLQRDNQSS